MVVSVCYSPTSPKYKAIKMEKQTNKQKKVGNNSVPFCRKLKLETAPLRRAPGKLGGK